ncbi:MAG: magnesium transporter [Alphaproteobacteria bacterium]|nr:magnesium transporter [Alphaproteobacteria bacterium]
MEEEKEVQHALQFDDAIIQQQGDSDDADGVGPSDAFIREILELLENNYTDRIQELCRDISAPDAADLLVKADKEDRRELVHILEDQLDPETFSYLDYEVLNDLFSHMPDPQIAAIVGALESDDAIRMVEDLDEDRRDGIMRHLSRKVRAAVEEGLTFPEESAGRMMQREFVAIPQFWTVGKTVDYLRVAAHALPDRFYDIFIVDTMHRFTGAVMLNDLLCAQRPVKIDTLVGEEHVTIPVDMDREQVAHLFRRKDLLSAPVIDADGRLIGMITVDDIVDVIDELAEEDFLKLGGVTDSDIFRPTVATVRSRFWWLCINLFTAFADTFVINLFSNTIEKVIALAALMPVVASMGGNAGTQTLAVAVRGIATKELTAANAWRIIGKELLVGSINGLLFGAAMIGIIMFWYHDLRLGLVMAAAMIFNLAAAGFTGAVIPIWLDRAGFDPAHSGAVFLTTVTDIVGFFAFLGLATLFLM